MHIDILAVPYDSARRGERMGAGPDRLIAAGLPRALEQAGYSVATTTLEAPADVWLAEPRTAFELARLVAAAVRTSVSAGAFPIVLSGNCLPAALGSVSGLRDPSVAWLDAHGDFNTPETTVGGFLDGMALATVTGRCWRELARGVDGFSPVPESSVTLIGARDLDPLERDALEQAAVRRPAIADARGAIAAAHRSRASLYFHLDLDVLDAGAARVNVYAVDGGLAVNDVVEVIGAAAQTQPISAAAITAYDPAYDGDGRAAEAAVELALALAEGARGR